MRVFVVVGVRSFPYANDDKSVIHVASSEQAAEDWILVERERLRGKISAPHDYDIEEFEVDGDWIG